MDAGWSVAEWSMLVVTGIAIFYDRQHLLIVFPILSTCWVLLHFGETFFLRIDRIKLAPKNAKISDPTPWHAILKEGAVQTGFHQLLHFSTKSSDVKFALCVKMAVFILQAVPNCWIANYLMPTRLIIPIPIQLLILQTFLYIPHICMCIVHTPIPKMLTYDLQFLQIMKISV